MSARRRPREVFISHAHQDRAFISGLTRLLDRHHIKYWYSPKHIVAAQQWHDEIGSALERCDWFLLVLSPAAVRSKWVGHEYFFALNDNRCAGRICASTLQKMFVEEAVMDVEQISMGGLHRPQDASAAAASQRLERGSLNLLRLS